MPDIWDDDQLLALLQDAMRESREVTPDFTEAGRDALAWRGIGGGLAQLTYDSELDRNAAAGVRAEAASIRALTFTSPHLTIELEVGENALLCQLVPTPLPHRGRSQRRDRLDNVVIEASWITLY